MSGVYGAADMTHRHRTMIEVGLMVSGRNRIMTDRNIWSKKVTHTCSICSGQKKKVTKGKRGVCLFVFRARKRDEDGGGTHDTLNKVRLSRIKVFFFATTGWTIAARAYLAVYFAFL